MKILIIEDEQPAAERLIKILKGIDSSISIEGPIDSITSAVDYLRKQKDLELIFLDIQLADGKCFNIFDQVKVEVPVIFVTAYDEYAIRAFELNSIDYLLKPVNSEKLEKSFEKFKKLKTIFYSKDHEVLKDLFKEINTNNAKVFKNRFLVNKGENLISIGVEDVAWFVAQDRFVFMVTRDNKRYIVNFNLDQLEKKLDPKDFFRINRQIICSLRSIKKVHSFFNYKLKLELYPSVNEETTVSKNRVSDFKQWLDS